MVSYRPDRKPAKCVVLLSTEHESEAINVMARPHLPDMSAPYEKTKGGGVDVSDKLMAEYSCHRGTKRWPVNVFCHLLNVAVANSGTLHRILNPQQHRGRNWRGDFIMDLGYELVWPQIFRRSGDQMLPR